MPELHRLTTEYIKIEDRIRIAGETPSGEALVLWLTNRLLSRLLPHLLGWLERQTGNNSRSEILQSFAQQAAMAEFKPQSAVQSQPQSQVCLVHAVDVTISEHNIKLTFKPAIAPTSSEPIILIFQALPLRQWLNILLEQWRKAEWPIAIWPEWLADTRTYQLNSPSVVWH